MLGDVLKRLVNVLDILLGIFVIWGSAHRLEKKQDKMTDETGLIYKISYIQEYIIIVVVGLAWLMAAIAIIKRYNDVILRYKRGEYFEVEGIAEDYVKYPHQYTFRVNGKEFQVYDFTHIGWGYNYRALHEDVITGDGQHLRIRYIPPSAIVYIEEIVEE